MQLNFKKQSRAPARHLCALPRASFFFLFRLLLPRLLRVLTIRLPFVLLPSCVLPNPGDKFVEQFRFFGMFHSQGIWRFSCIRLAMSAKCNETRSSRAAPSSPKWLFKSKGGILCARERAFSIGPTCRRANRQGEGERVGRAILPSPLFPPFLRWAPMGERAERGKAFIQPGFGLVVRPPSAWLSVGRPTVRVCPFGVNHILSSRDRPLSTGLMVIVLFYCFCGKLPGSGTPCT